MNIFTFLVFAIIAFHAKAGEVATTETGRKVQLNDDGTWQELSGDDIKKTADASFTVPQTQSGKSSSNTSYSIVNTFTTNSSIHLCVEAKNKTKDKIAEPKFTNIACADDGTNCSVFFTGLLTDGNNNNLKAKIGRKTELKFVGAGASQVSLYPQESVYFKMFGKRPINFSEMKLKIDGTLIKFEAISEIQRFPKLDAKQMLKDSSYSSKRQKEIDRLICKEHKPIG